MNKLMMQRVGYNLAFFFFSFLNEVISENETDMRSIAANDNFLEATFLESME